MFIFNLCEGDTGLEKYIFAESANTIPVQLFSLHWRRTVGIRLSIIYEILNKIFRDIILWQLN